MFGSSREEHTVMRGEIGVDYYGSDSVILLPK